MEGAWHLYRPGSRWRRPAHEARVVLRTEDWTAVGFALGIVELLARATEGDAVGHLGPDLLGPDWDQDEAVRRIAASLDVPIGQALLDQRNLAGLGNVYKSEALFLSGLDPARPVSEVPDLRKLVALGHRLINANRDRATRATTGDLRKGRQYWVYGRAGQPCRRCGTRIVSAEQGDQGVERITYWCPSCQPRGRVTDAPDIG
jgi:endonuclease-8